MPPVTNAHAVFIKTTARQAACQNTTNPAFSNPDDHHSPNNQRAIQTCKDCPILTECAKQALTAGDTLAGDYRAPSSGVIQAGVVCHGDYDTAAALAQIAGTSVPDHLIKPTGSRANTGSARRDKCINCEKPMVQWNRGQTPEGYVMHYARGFCTGCRTAYRKWKQEHRVPSAAKGIRKEIDRKRHSAPARHDRVVQVQFSLFDLPDSA